MGLPLKESNACTEMAQVLYSFLPGSGSSAWKGHVTFASVAEKLGLGNFWRGGSKQPAIAYLLEQTLEHRRSAFERLILTIVKEGLRHRSKKDDPVRREEIEKLNMLIAKAEFKFPYLWDPAFLDCLAVPTSQEIRKEDSATTEDSHIADKPVVNVGRLQSLEQDFYELCGMDNRQSAGRKLEFLLNELFALFCLEPRIRLRVTGEEMDGSFSLDNNIYLVEAKWHKKPSSVQHLYVFDRKLSSKSPFTRGVFISIKGITANAEKAVTTGAPTRFFCMDGWDLTTVLQGRIRLDTLLREKMRMLAEKGRVMISAKELIEGERPGDN